MNYLIIILCIKTFKNVVIMDLVENDERVVANLFVYLVYENEMSKGKKWSPRHNGSIKKIGLWP